ncbi:MAG: HNH endonuclease [Desulfuromonadaceae bacterium]|nr:HNH endonuclease [Desulfuromonadaceae bacterium]
MNKDSNDYTIPMDRFNNTIYLLSRVAEADLPAVGSMKSTLSFLYLHEGPVNLPRERLKASEPFLEPRELVIVRWLQTRTNGNLRSKYGAKALLAARNANYRCVTCGFSDVRALHLDHIDGHTIDTDFACLCANCHNIKSRKMDWSGDKKY